MLLFLPILISFIFAVGGYSLAIEPFSLKVNYYTFQSNRIPKEFDGYKIAVLGDIHYARYLGKGYLNKIINITNSLNVDLIAGVGDYVKSHNNIKDLRTAWSSFNALNARDGVFMVNGNHDHWAGHEESLFLLESSGVSIRHRHKIIRKNGWQIAIGGAGDFYEDIQGIDIALKNIPENTFRIVLAHNPDTADTSYREKVDLFLSGHTHGGQVSMPIWNYAPILPVKNKIYNQGFKKNKKGESIFITRGIGTSILPIRFNAQPEIAVIILKHSPS